MKIVMLCDIYDEKAQYQDNLFAKYYAKHGHEVTIIASTINNIVDYYAGRERFRRNAARRIYWDGSAKVIKLPHSISLMNRLLKLKGVAAVLEHEKPDLIFSHDIHLNLWEAVHYRRAHPGCRIIMDYHADYSNSGRNWISRLLLHRLTRKQLLDYCRPYIDKLYPVVPGGLTFLNEIYGVPRHLMELLPLGADLDLARHTRASK